MSARGSRMTIVAVLCALTCVLVIGTASAGAAATRFGSGGHASGQLEEPTSVAFDQATGDVYVGDYLNNRIDVFNGSGSFLFAFGWDVNGVNPAEELQTCTSSCQAGSTGGIAGEFAQGRQYVTVDNDPLSLSYGDVYVADANNYRVQKFSSSGEFLSMFGAGVVTPGASGTGELKAGEKEIKSVVVTSGEFREGQTITGTGIPAGTTITGLGPHAIYLSQAATVSGTGVALTVAAGAGVVPTNAQQTLTVSATGGTFALTYRTPEPAESEASTASISYHATAGEVQSALEGLSNIGAGNVAVTGPAGGPYTVTFQGTRYADTNVKQLKANSSGLTGASHEATVVTSQTGGGGAEVCTVAAACQMGTQGTADGQFEWADHGPFESFRTPQQPGGYEVKTASAASNYLAVGPGGAVYVGDKARVQVFEQTGVWRENISLTGLSSTDRVTELAVNAAGDMFVADGSGVFPETEATVPGVREFAPNGMEMATRFDVGSTTIDSLALDGSGDLFVGDSSGGGFHILEYDSGSGVLLASIAANLPEVALGTAYASTLGALYVTGFDERTPGDSENGEEPGVWIVTPAVSGPPSIEAVSGTPLLRGDATLEAKFDPDGHETKYHFEYIDNQEFEAGGYAGAVSTPEVSVAATLEEQSASVALTGLTPGETYHYRFVASNSQSPTPVTSADQSFEEVPAALVRGPWVTDVADTSVTFGAEIDPLGVNTEYKLEYGTSIAYGNTLVGNVGEGEGYVSIAGALHRQGLQPGTLYHYRIVTYSEVGTVIGPDHTLKTQAVSTQEPALPDGREWELVSPPDKKGSLIEPFETDLIQAADDGDGIAYLSLEAIGEGGAGKSGFAPSQILSSRVPGGGWRTEDLAIPHTLVAEGENPALMTLKRPEYMLFSPDLEQAVVEPRGVVPPLSAEVDERTVYLRDNADGGFTPLVDAADVPEGTRYGGTLVAEEKAEIHYLAATPDLSHVVLEAPYPLTAQARAPSGRCLEELVNGFCPADEGNNLYEWSAGSLKLVDVLPDGEPLQISTGDEGAYLGVGYYHAFLAAHTVSDNGRWVVWSPSNNGKLYVRDMVAEKTYQVGGGHPTFQTMTSNGSRVFFLEGGELYEFDTETGTQTDVTAAHGASASAGVQDAIMGASEDGSYVYLVAKGVLAPGGVAGQDNVYELHEEAGAWNAVFVAALSNEDDPDWFPTRGAASEICVPEVDQCPVNLGHDVSSVSPDGRFLEFMSDRSLTGYDNTDAVSGHADEEVFLFDADNDRLVCASCDPTGARPLGLLDVYNGIGGPLVDDAGTWGNNWIAANVPGWGGGSGEDGRGSSYQPRFLSDSGRLFFDSADALVPQDTDGVEDVYEYEPPGVGSCTTVSATFSTRSDGCVGLISSGTSSAESAFLDASENGNDVFFETESKLVAADYDNNYDVYDAHVCGAEGVPCTVETVSPPACTTEASCRAAPTPQPEIFGPAPSATFSGAGNVVEEPVTTVKSRTKTKKKAKKSKKKRVKAKKARKAGRALKQSRTGRANGKGVER